MRYKNLSDYMYCSTIENMEEIVDDDIYPAVRNKTCWYSFLEGWEAIILYFSNFKSNSIDATQKNQWKKV